MKNLRLFGVKSKGKEVKIQDMRFLAKVGTVKVPVEFNEYWYEVAYLHLDKCGFKIIGETTMPKYDVVYICEENPNSLISITEEVLKPKYIEIKRRCKMSIIK